MAILAKGMMDFSGQLALDKKRIDSFLEKALDDEFFEFTDSPYAKPMMNRIREYTLRGGKRLRGMLVIYGFRAYSDDDDEILWAASAIELMEAFLLCHDDIMDNDDIRRGGPAMHKLLELDFGDADGVNAAIIAGDMMAAMGNQLLLRSDFSKAKIAKAANIFNNAILWTCIGQTLDLKARHAGCNEAFIGELHRLKTTKYSIEAPLKIGASLSDADESEYQKLSKYALAIGEAFQLQDDIIGLYGSEKKIGKPVGSDIREGKRTLLIQKACDAANESDKSTILQILGKKDATIDEVEKIRKIVKMTGALDYSNQKAAVLIQEAIDELGSLDIRQESKEFLHAFAEYMTRREY